MGIIAQRTRHYPPPAAGQHDAVLVDVIDEGERDSQWGTAHKVRLMFELEPTTAGVREDGRRHVVSAWYTLSLAPSANLTRDLTDWGVIDDDSAQVDLERLIERPARIVLVHAEGREGRTVARVKCILPADPAHKLIPSGEYERRGTGASAERATGTYR